MKRHQILLLHIATSILVLFPFPIHAHKMMYQDSIEIVVHRGATIKNGKLLRIANPDIINSLRPYLDVEYTFPPPYIIRCQDSVPLRLRKP